ncbi:DUF2637 domain-containing protein [Streptomyces sp. NPDC001922]|uniref:DUF2637 domain-containing protein n=1 Tax=Streptomyces sp. NPDC001922 TaxID=3364624 RepID=UPI00368AE8A4
MAATQLTRTHRILIGVVVAGAIVIAAIGFAGSYSAVRELAAKKGFGSFSAFFPIGIDAGIVVLLALDLLLTWIRIPFPLLRQTAWLLTAATIAFNGAAAWPDPLGVGMHAVIPVLFVVAVEAARHAVGRIADITADRHMESVRVARWLLAFPSTFRLWRRMKLWELRSYDEVIQLEQDRLVYQARLRARYGRSWRRRAPVESLMPLRLARYGVPLSRTGAAGLAAAGIDPAVLPAGGRSADRTGQAALPASGADGRSDGPERADGHAAVSAPDGTDGGARPHPSAREDGRTPPVTGGPQDGPGTGLLTGPADDRRPNTGPEEEPYTAPRPQEPYTAPQDPAWGAAPRDEAGAPSGEQTPQVTVPVAPGRVRALRNARLTGYSAGTGAYPAPHRDAPQPEGRQQDGQEQDVRGDAPSREAPPREATQPRDPAPAPDHELFVDPFAGTEADADDPVAGLPDDVPRDEAYFAAYRQYVAESGVWPDTRQFGRYLLDRYGVRGRSGGPLSENYLRGYTREFRDRLRMEMQTEHSP